MKQIILIIIMLITAFSLPTNSSAGRLRIVSLAPSTTEILFALGADDEIVGVSQFCNYPEEALAKEKVGTFSQPNVERIIALKPDIVFCTGLEQGPIITKLKQLNFNVHVSDPSSINELYASIIDIGRAVGREVKAQELVSAMSAEISGIASVTNKIPDDDRPKVFAEIWHSPLMTAAKGSFLDELIALAGGINISHDANRPYAIYSPEEVISRNPDVIILGYMGNPSDVQAVGKRVGWRNISAVRSGRVYNDIEPDIFLKPGPRLVLGLKEIHKKLYP